MEKIRMIGASMPSGKGFLAVLSEAVECGCGRMAMIVINNDGKTRCTECNTAYENEKLN